MAEAGQQAGQQQRPGDARQASETTDPPSSDPAISGNSWASDTSPTSRDERVSWYT
jgi:hypothetical protein